MENDYTISTRKLIRLAKAADAAVRVYSAPAWHDAMNWDQHRDSKRASQKIRDALGALNQYVAQADAEVKNIAPVNLFLLAAMAERDVANGRGVSRALLYFLERNDPRLHAENVEHKPSIGHIVDYMGELTKERALQERAPMLAKFAAYTALRGEPDWWLDPTVRACFSAFEWGVMLQSFARHMSPAGLLAEAKLLDSLTGASKKRTIAKPVTPEIIQAWHKAVKEEIGRSVAAARHAIAKDWEKIKSAQPNPTTPEQRAALTRYNIAAKIITLKGRRGEDLDILNERRLSLATDYLLEWHLLDQGLEAVAALAQPPIAPVAGATRYETETAEALSQAAREVGIFARITDKHWCGNPPKPLAGGTVAPKEKGRFSGMPVWLQHFLGRDKNRVRLS